MGEKFLQNVDMTLDLETRTLDVAGHVLGLVRNDEAKGGFDIVDKDGEDIDLNSIFNEETFEAWCDAVEAIPDGSVVKLKGTLHLEMEVVTYGSAPEEKAVEAGVD